MEQSIAFKLMMEELAPGESRRCSCPECGRKNTFTMTKEEDGHVVWNCYSANCPVAGASSGGDGRPNLLKHRHNERRQRTHPFTGDLREINEAERQFLRDRIGWTDVHRAKSGVLFAPTEGRYAYPILAPTGKRRGWVLRAYDGHDPRWKALTRLEVEEPHLSWYQGTEHSNRVLVVEDIPSAVRAAEHFPGWCVAMCGGGMGPDYVREIASMAKHIVWAFDADATAAALRHHRIYGICFESSRVLPLEADLKDVAEPTLKEVLSHVS